MVKLFMHDTDRVSDEDIRSVRACFPDRYSRAVRMIDSRDGLAVIAAGALMIRALGVTEESRVLKNAEGKPYIAGGPEFSISHSRGRCVLAVSRRRVGVDIERLDESNLIAAGYALTDEEREWIAASPTERFHLLWTRKESVYKAVGGFREPREIPSLDRRIPRGLYVKSVISDGYALSVCSEEEIGPIEPTRI